MRPVMILAGGTGGHVFPALAVANELRDRGVPIIWVGTVKGIEAKVVPAEGFSLVTMSVQGLRKKGMTQYLRAPLIIMQALYESFRIVLKHKPCALLGMGGFVSGPCALIGVLLRKPLIIHEQNAIVGLTNKILSPLSRMMFTGFPIQYKKQKIEFTGNPVRKNLIGLADPKERLAHREGVKRLLVIGGSQGSVALNKVMPQAIQILSESMNVEVWHQCGTFGYEQTENDFQHLSIKSNVEPFIENVDKAYEWADLIVCRSGAITLAEIASVGIASILVPYPHAVDDHQTENARSYVSAGASCLVAEDDLTPEKLSGVIKSILEDDLKLINMACAAKKLSHINASKRVAEECMHACGCDAQMMGAK